MMTNFEKLKEKNPKAALKQVKQFIESPFWEYWLNYMETTKEIFMHKLVLCDVEDIFMFREKIKSLTEAMSFPLNQIETLQDLVELQKEAARVEEARTK